ncbi:MAG: hypothetical protein O2819_01595 [Planctomycetota bacterium]|nr:hypothetical protein [Planctomycetota bacterium]MDA1105043.1 hypothetical protein [Planctomycetota bacterium]
MHTTSRQHGRAFTLTEILVAVVVLVVVIAATAQIFGTAGKVAGLGQANQDLLQESSVVERMVRQDLEALANEGYMLIQCVAVRNDAPRFWPTGDPNAPLLDATKDAGEYLRADRIVFFRHGQEETNRFIGSRDQGSFGGLPAATMSRVTYGHGVQMADSVIDNGTTVQRLDPAGFDDGPLTPWAGDNPLDGPSLDTLQWPSGAGGPRRNGRQPESREWILARSSVLLANDGGSRDHLSTDNSYGPSATVSLFQQANAWQSVNAPTPAYDIISSRVDAATSTIDEVQRAIGNGLVPVNGSSWGVFYETNLPFWTSASLWNQQVRGRLIGGNFGPFIGAVPVGGYPRAEKVAPSMDRQDQMLVAPMLAGNCSSFSVDWTWDRWVGHEHTGDHDSPDLTVSNAAGTQSWPTSGYIPNFAEPRVWYGLPDGLPGQGGAGAGPDARGIYSLTERVGTGAPAGFSFSTGAAQPTLYPPLWDPVSGIGPQRIEGGLNASLAVPQPVAAWPSNGNPVLWVYTATFGFNHDEGVSVVVDASTDPVTIRRSCRTDVTPLPSALRFTARLHDQEKRIEKGKELQFVVELTRAGGRER